MADPRHPGRGGGLTVLRHRARAGDGPVADTGHLDPACRAGCPRRHRRSGRRSHRGGEARRWPVGRRPGPPRPTGRRRLRRHRDRHCRHRAGHRNLAGRRPPQPRLGFAGGTVTGTRHPADRPGPRRGPGPGLRCRTRRRQPGRRARAGARRRSCRPARGASRHGAVHRARPAGRRGHHRRGSRGPGRDEHTRSPPTSGASRRRPSPGRNDPRAPAAGMLRAGQPRQHPTDPACYRSAHLGQRLDRDSGRQRRHPALRPAQRRRRGERPPSPGGWSTGAAPQSPSPAVRPRTSWPTCCWPSAPRCRACCSRSCWPASASGSARPPRRRRSPTPPRPLCGPTPFGLYGLVQAGGDLGSTVVAGLLWSWFGPGYAFGYAAAWMVLAVLLAPRLQQRRGGPGPV